MHKLNAKMVEAQSEPGYYIDGGGLYLQVSATGTKSWVFKFTLNGRSREMGLGPMPPITLAKARVRAAHCRELLVDKIDPIEARRIAQAASAKSLTFDECSAQYIKDNGPRWTNDKHVAQWTNTLAAHASPVFGKLPVRSIDTALIVRALSPIWQTTPETAGRVRGRIEKVLDWATVSGYRSGENPARFKGHLEHKLPKVAVDEKHHAAMPYTALPAFVADLRGREAISARALEFVILTAARTSDVIDARWEEIDMTGAEWIIPGARMKSKKEHRIPLTPSALAVLTKMAKIADEGYVFPGTKEATPMSNMAMAMLLKRMGSDVTVHGFRSSFREWAGEQTNHPREVIEHALAHQLKNKAEAAYQRGSLLPKRIRLMADWSDYCNTGIEKPRAEVVAIQRAA